MAKDIAEAGGIRTLRRVVPIASTNTRHGLGITLLALEDYADGFDVACRLVVQAGHPVRDLATAKLEEGQARLRALMEARQAGVTHSVAPMVVSSGSPPTVPDTLWPAWDVTARDDRGNSYRGYDLGGREFEISEFRIKLSFSPALDSDARKLWIDITQVSWTILSPTHDDRTLERVDHGPWIFPVDLESGLHVIQLGTEDNPMNCGNADNAAKRSTSLL